ncbi:MAG TPA: hypothetical protein VFO65_12115, partial [Acidimicrobiales bacterium]|nr:hypothetical protein [Acidimicrobiales bacterium]
MRPPPTELPFNVVDEVVHLLDTPSEPWSIELELEVTGRLDDDRLRAAVGAALQHHPMARARMVPARRVDRRYRWEISERPDLDPLGVLECGDDDGVDAARIAAAGRLD